MTALAVGWALSGNAELRTALRTHPLRPLGNALFAVGFLVAGHYLGKGSRRAAIVAVTVFCVPVLTALFGEATLGNAVIGGIGILIIFSIRDELT
ncbi:MAG: hypothetical protein HOP28_01410 [Gemmatimonadales bacterium]|nr:hypothetical protein [Gemmatimonadales bacterium]